MWLLCIALLAQAADPPAAPTEADKERQQLLDMGIDPAALEALEKMAMETLEAAKGAEDVNQRIALLNEAMARRGEIGACQGAAIERAGAPITGEIAWSVAVDAAGAVQKATEVRRSPTVDAALAKCAAEVIRRTALPAEGKTQTIEVVVSFPYTP